MYCFGTYVMVNLRLAEKQQVDGCLVVVDVGIPITRELFETI